MTLRFSSLGRDDEGRQYFALSPSILEKEAASNIISDELEEVGTAPKKSTGGGRARRGGAFVSGGVSAMDESKREEFWNWDWFVAVWGRKPDGAVVAPDPHFDEDDGDRTDDDEDEGGDKPRSRERWWAFWRPQDISNLSRWIAHQHGLDHEHADHDPEKTEKAESRSSHLLVPQNRPSAASSTADTFSDRASTAYFDHHGDAMDVDEGHETDDAPREGSPLTDFEESGDETGNKKLLDSSPNSKPSQRAVKELATALSGYARLLEWRVQRGDRERKAKQKD